MSKAQVQKHRAVSLEADESTQSPERKFYKEKDINMNLKTCLKCPTILVFLCVGILSTPNAAHSNERCLTVEDNLIHGISEKLISKNAAAVKSNDYDEVYFIASKFTDSNEIGLWVSNSLTYGQGMLFSANDAAIQKSSWPDGRNAAFKVSKNDDGYQLAVNCIQHK